MSSQIPALSHSFLCDDSWFCHMHHWITIVKHTRIYFLLSRLSFPPFLTALSVKICFPLYLRVLSSVHQSVRWLSTSFQIRSCFVAHTSGVTSQSALIRKRLAWWTGSGKLTCRRQYLTQLLLRYEIHSKFFLKRSFVFLFTVTWAKYNNICSCISMVSPTIDNVLQCFNSARFSVLNCSVSYFPLPLT